MAQQDMNVSFDDIAAAEFGQKQNMQLQASAVGRLYVVTFSETFTALISLQPRVGNQAYMPQIKAIYVLFQMVYSRLMCCLRLQSERPMC